MQALQLCKQNLSEVVAAFKLFCLFIQSCNTVEEINLGETKSGESSDHDQNPDPDLWWIVGQVHACCWQWVFLHQEIIVTGLRLVVTVTVK